MVGSRWLRRIGPALLALGGVGVIASVALGAGARSWTPPACAGPAGGRGAAARAPVAADLGGLRGSPWFRLDPRLDGGGGLSGQRLTVGLDGSGATRALDLPAESFAAGPFGRVVLAGSDDGVTSRIQAIDVASGCAWTIAEEAAVIRRATIDPAGRSVYETRVDRGSRTDLGVWRRALDGSGAAARVLAPIPVDGRFGRTFTTEFSWQVAGDRLAVQSCGEVACRTRVISSEGIGQTLASPDLGTLIGLDGDRAITYAACRGLPCPIVSTDLQTGRRQTIAAAAGLAVVIPTPDGVRVVHEDVGPAGRRLHGLAPDGGFATDLGPLPDGLRLQPSAVGAGAATRLPPGWVLLAPEGRLPLDPVATRSQLRHLPDGSTVDYAEAVR
ncbi:MAG: hypothetical protein QOG32_142 [Chloroflexota bacterium]|nr:hypothetical protein [Chloroflexota bacterium]